MTGYTVSPEALHRIADGIDTVVDGLRALSPRGPAEQGRGIEQLAYVPGDVGHDTLSSAFVAFCSRWEWGVRAAVQDGTDLADGLRATVADYARADEDGADLFARVAFDLVGDPADTGDTWADVDAARRPDPRPPDLGELAAAGGEAANALVGGSWAMVVLRALRGEGPPPDPLDDLRPIAQ